MRIKILIVDDHIENWTWTIRYFRRHTNYIPYLAATVEAALRELADSKFDLVICDGSIHRMGDGKEFALKLHQAGQKVLLCSGDDWSDSIGDMPYLIKPVIIDELEVKIHEILLLKD